ncbi:unnamed protein product, partial [Prorocentrum cordatum]
CSCQEAVPCPDATPCVCPRCLEVAPCPECPAVELGWEEVAAIGIASWVVQTALAVAKSVAVKACLRRLLPGKRFLAWYDADVVYHERIAVWPQTRDKWFILTPDLDMYADVLDGSEGADGVTRLLDFRPGGRLLPLDKVTDAVMPDREVVPLDSMFGGRFLPRRLAAAPAAGDGPPADAAAGPQDIPKGYAWLLMEGGRAGGLGDEVNLSFDDYGLSDYDAMILRHGQGRRAGLVPLTELDETMRARREELVAQLQPA